jgi:hypothetical protein
MISPSSRGMSSYPDESEQVAGIDELMNFAEKSHTKVEHADSVIQRRPGRPQGWRKHSTDPIQSFRKTPFLKK